MPVAEELPDTIDSALLTDTIIVTTDSTAVSVQETDPHQREYYIKQIPYSSEDKAKSDQLITEALLQQGIIYKDRLMEYPDAEKSFVRITTQYPQAQEADKAYYKLYLMYSLWGKTDIADSCRARMQRFYPESDYTVMVFHIRRNIRCIPARQTDNCTEQL